MFVFERVHDILFNNEPTSACHIYYCKKYDIWCSFFVGKTSFYYDLYYDDQSNKMITEILDIHPLQITEEHINLLLLKSNKV